MSISAYPRSILVVIFALCLSLAGCESLTGTDQLEPPRALSAQEQEVVASSQHFGLNLFRAVHEGAPDQNIFISPLSVSMALGMTLNGAEGETREAMKETLAFAGLSEAEINAGYRDLIDLLTGLDPRVRMKIANSIWHREGFSVEEDFLETNHEYFDASVEALDFSSDEAVDIMNAWVAEHTEGLIKEIIEAPIDPQIVMYLINAIYFQGDWRYQFDASDTEQKPFTRADGSETQVEMMQQEADLPYFATDRFQAVDLPYGDSLFSMTVVMPNDPDEIGALAQELDGDTWQSWTDQFRPAGIRLELPKFTLEWEQELNDMLIAMGMEPAFDPMQSDFSGINEESGTDLYIDEVMHSTFLEVDEEGTEAAAATSVGIGAVCVGCASGPRPVIIDQPFLLVIREHHSGTILFIGQVLDPTE